MKPASITISTSLCILCLSAQALADLTVLPGEEYNNTFYENHGTVTNLGTFNNNNFIINFEGSNFINLDSVNNYGIFENQGFIEI